MKNKKRAWNCKYLLQFANLNAGHLFEDVYYLKDLHSATGFMGSCKIYMKFATASFNWISIKRQFLEVDAMEIDLRNKKADL